MNTLGDVYSVNINITPLTLQVISIPWTNKIQQLEKEETTFTIKMYNGTSCYRKWNKNVAVAGTIKSVITSREQLSERCILKCKVFHIPVS